MPKNLVQYQAILRIGCQLSKDQIFIDMSPHRGVHPMEVEKQIDQEVKLLLETVINKFGDVNRMKCYAHVFRRV